MNALCVIFCVIMLRPLCMISSSSFGVSSTSKVLRVACVLRKHLLIENISSDGEDEEDVSRCMPLAVSCVVLRESALAPACISLLAFDIIIMLLARSFVVPVKLRGRGMNNGN